MRDYALTAALALAIACSCGPRRGAKNGTGTVGPRWAVTLVGTDYATASDLAVGPGDLVAVTGGYSGSFAVGSHSLPASADQDGFVALLGADGSPRWLRGIGGRAFDHLRAVAMSTDGRVAVSGVASPGAQLDGHRLPPSFIAVLSVEGALLWLLGVESTEASAIADLGFTKNGDLVAVGYGTGTIRVGDHSVTSAGSLDAIMMRIDSKGVAKWLKRAGGKAADYARGLAVRGDQLAVVGGFARTAEFGSATLRSNHNEDGFLAMLDADGRLAWINTFGGSARDSALAVAADDSQIVVAGVFASDDANFGTGTLRADESGDQAAGFLAAYSAKGQPRWAVKLGESPSEAMAVTIAAAQVWAGGSYSGAQVMGSVDLDAHGKRDLALIRLGAEGVAQAGLSAGGPEQDDLAGLALTTGGDVVIAGNFTSSLQLATHGLRAASHGGRAAFVARLASR